MVAIGSRATFLYHHARSFVWLLCTRSTAELACACAASLDEIAVEQRWTRDRARTFGVVATVYSGLPDGVRLWSGDGRYRRLLVEDLVEVRRFGRDLVEG
jgi:hypothetical protein